MKRVKAAAGKDRPVRVALTLSWDGSRCPTSALPVSARAFLRGKSKQVSASSPAKLARLFDQDAVTEIRVCWVPRLIGGDHVLADPFLSTDGRRIAFRATKTKRFGDVLGVVYRRVAKGAVTRSQEELARPSASSSGSVERTPG